MPMKVVISENDKRARQSFYRYPAHPKEKDVHPVALKHLPTRLAVSEAEADPLLLVQPRIAHAQKPGQARLLHKECYISVARSVYWRDIDKVPVVLDQRRRHQKPARIRTRGQAKKAGYGLA